MKPSRRSRAIGRKEVCAYGFLFCLIDRNRKVSPKGSPEVALALNACAQSEREKSRTNARAVLTRFWAGSGSGLPYAVVVARYIIGVVVSVVVGDCRGLRVQTKYIVCVEVENGAKISERIKRGHSTPRKILPYGGLLYSEPFSKFGLS